MVVAMAGHVTSHLAGCQFPHLRQLVAFYENARSAHQQVFALRRVCTARLGPGNVSEEEKVIAVTRIRSDDREGCGVVGHLEEEHL